MQVNKGFFPYLKCTSRYLHLWGGSGSGKSMFAAQKIIARIISEEKHRILCCRKVAKTLRYSVFSLFCDIIYDLGLEDEFKIYTGHLRIVHRNGNEILFSGLDDVNKLKSIVGVTGIWIEEATEITANDFDQLDLRLRGITPGYKQILFTYNPVDEKHWIKARFHDQPMEDFTTYRSTFVNNKFIDPEYRKTLERKAMVNPNFFRIYYEGEWGKEEIERPYVYNFNKENTVSPMAVYKPDLPVYFSIDFNVEPFICICAHIWRDAGGMHYHIFKELVIEKSGDVYKMLDLICNTFSLRALSNSFFTGDAMQRKREISQRENIDAWRIIDRRLRLGRRLMLPNANPSVRNNRYLVNAITAFHPDFKINPACKRLIYDLQYVEADESGDIIKVNRKRQHQRADALDTFRYQCNTHLSDFYKWVDVSRAPQTKMAA
jgi:phage terminase large subunit